MKQKKKSLGQFTVRRCCSGDRGGAFLPPQCRAERQHPGRELIYGDANTVQKISLDKDAVYDIDTGYLTVHIEVKDGAARFIDCPLP